MLYWRFAPKVEVIDSSISSDNAENIINLLNNTNNLLVRGNVQSGKTKNILSTISKAINSGYDLIIFFAGTTNLLLDQTKKRLKEIEKLSSDIAVPKFNSFNDRLLLNFGTESGKRIVNVITVLKRHKQILNLLKVLNESHINDKGKNMVNKVMIIDDESDFISVKNKKKAPVYNALKQIVSVLRANGNKEDRLKYLAFTATPFINILNDSEDNIVNFEIMYSLVEPSDYTGIDNYTEKNGSYINVEPSTEIAKNELIRDVIVDHIIRSSFFKTQNNDFTHSELVINNDIEKNEHDLLKADVSLWITKIASNPSNYFSKELISNYNGKFAIDTVGYEKIMEAINSFLVNNEISIQILNSDNSFEKTSKEINIIIGGNLISRGITFENLITELILNLPSQEGGADVMMQKARWLGYRKDKHNFQRIYLTSASIEKYELIIKLIEIFEDSFDVKTRVTVIENIRERLMTFDAANHGFLKVTQRQWNLAQ